VFVVAADKGDKPLIQPTSPAALTSGTKAETERSAEEMIQPKKAPAPTKTGKLRLPSPSLVVTINYTILIGTGKS